MPDSAEAAETKQKVDTGKPLHQRPELLDRVQEVPVMSVKAANVWIFHRSSKVVSNAVHANRASCQDSILSDHEDRIVRAEQLLDHLYAIGLLRGIPELRKPVQSERRDGFGRRLSGAADRTGEAA